MNTNMHGGGRRKSLWKGPALFTVLILSIPLLRSLFVSGWDWDVRVFVLVGAVGTLLFGMGLACQMVIRNLGTTVYRVAVGVALVTAFGLVWGNFVQAADDVNPAAPMSCKPTTRPSSKLSKVVSRRSFSAKGSPT